VTAAGGKLFVYDLYGNKQVKVFDTHTGAFLIAYKPQFGVETDWIFGMTVSKNALYLYFMDEFYNDFFHGYVIHTCSVQNPNQQCSYKFYEREFEDADEMGLTMVTDNTIATLVHDYDSNSYKIVTFTV
jgi:hypothetical protein